MVVVCIRGELHKESRFQVALCSCYATVRLMGALFKMFAKMTRFSNWKFLVKS